LSKEPSAANFSLRKRKEGILEERSEGEREEGLIGEKTPLSFFFFSNVSS
jgi:hypothetical protein